jgi:hypothetical protein
MFAKSGITVGTSGSACVPVTTVYALAAASAWGSTVLALSASHAGKILTVAVCSGAGGVLTLPKASGLTVGTEYKVCTVSTFTASGLRISSSLSSSNDMILGGASGKSIQCSKDTSYNFVTITLVGEKRWGVYPAWSTAFNNWSCTGVIA